jgi:exopolysaccharide biosynthesis polyprenyl glycosylphosphotransferase
MIVIPMLYSQRKHGSEFFGLAFVALLLGSLTAGRFLCRSLIRFVGTRWPTRPKVALVGDQERAAGIAWRLQETKAADVRGVILSNGHRDNAERGRINVLGTTTNLAEVINRERLDTLVLVDAEIPEMELQAFREVSARMGVNITWSFSPAPVKERVVYWEDCGIPLLELETDPFSKKQRFFKRAIDILGSSVLLILLAPVMLVIAALIKITSPGPVFFAAPRVGRGGRYFMFLKFRSMRVNSGRADVAARNEKNGHLFKIRHDPRVTPLGRFIRRYSLDELPQLINVLVGDMSLVGPRPLPIEDLGPDGMSRTFAIWSEHRASVPPGITGLWQIRGRSELPFADLVRHDLEYVHNWSLKLDLTILLQTPLQVFFGRGAF